MALSLKNREADALAREVAALTGETLTEAVRGALAVRLRIEQLRRGRRPKDDGSIQRIIDHCAALPILDDRSDDEILGYDENGLPA